MNDKQVSDPSDRFQVDANAQTHFAWLRTRLAVERTMMASLRTSVSLIGFGFGIFQFVFNLHGSPEATSVRFPNSSWYLGLALILCGIMAAIYSVAVYRWTLRYLWSGSYAAVAGMTREGRHTPLYAVSFVLIVVGIFAFFAVLRQIG
jgi:putative membrane protein